MVLVQQTVVQMKSTWAFSYDSLILNWTFFSRRISSVKYWKKEFYKPNNLSLLLFWNWPSLNIQTCTVVITDHFQFFHFTEFISTNWTLILYLQKKIKIHYWVQWGFWMYKEGRIWCQIYVCPAAKVNGRC